MSLDAFGVVRPGQNLGTGPVDANHYPEFTGKVAETIERKSKIAPHVEIQNVQGTTVLSQDGVGESTLGVITPGQTPDQTSPNQFNRISMTIDTVVLARTMLPILDVFQKRYDVRSKIAREHGKKIAKLYDESFAIQAIKAGRLTTNKYGLPGFVPGSQEYFATAGDAYDPARLMAGINNLFAKMGEKDVDAQDDNLILVLRPTAFTALAEAEQIVNGNYINSQGVEMYNTKMLKAFNVPVISSTSLPNTNITTHPLGTEFTGDFTKTIGVAFSPEAILAGETIPLQSKVFFDDVSKHHYVDAWLSWGATVNNNAYSGVLEIQ